MDCSLPTPLSMGCPRQEYWSGVPFPSPGDLSHPGIEPRSSALQADFFFLPTELQGKPKENSSFLCCFFFLIGYLKTIVDPEEGEAVPASLQKLYGGPDIRSKLCMKGSVPKWELEVGVGGFMAQGRPRLVAFA